MTTKDVIDSLSAVLLNDERVISARERELLTNLLQHANGSHLGGDPPGREAIARAVGETIAQRAYEILGEGVLRQLLHSSGGSAGQAQAMVVPPVPPSPSPGPPGPRGPHAGEARGEALYVPPVPPSPSPGPPGPRGPHGIAVETPERLAESAVVAVLEPADAIPAQCVVFDEFLAPAEIGDLLSYTLQREAQFELSEVVTPGVGGTVDFDCRRSRVLMELEKHHDVLVNRIYACLPQVLAKLGRSPFKTSQVEAQITASNDGDFFRWHSDSGHPETSSREITFVYFFHREPKQFRGGELRIYDSRVENGLCAPTESYRAIIPQQNHIVFFPSSLAHEITPVECPSRAFADSRFTVNGWLRR